MKKIIIFFILVFYSLAGLAHQNTTFPILVNKQIKFKNSESMLSIVADADLNKTKLKFILSKKHPVKIYVSTLNGVTLNFSGEAKIDPLESTNEQLVLWALLPLNEEKVWQLQFTLTDESENPPKIMEKFTLPLEILPEGPSFNEFLIYMVPFIIVAFIGFKIFIHKKRKIA